MSEEQSINVIAIDGPAASGKSTVSRKVAERMDWVYVDSGSFYRGLTWYVLQQHVDPCDADAVAQCMKAMDWKLMLDGNNLVFEIDGVNPGMEIRSEPVREQVSTLASIPMVRSFVVDELRKTVSFGPVVMEGRDIGSVVFPDTACKYYLDADPEERARRRSEEIQEMEGVSDVQEVMESLARRDKIDTTRKTAPLQIPLGAIVVNSTHMGIDEVVDHIYRDAQARL